MRPLVLASAVAVVLAWSFIALTGSGRGATIPTGGPLTWADVDCQEGVTTRDNQAVLREVLDQNSLSQTEPCPDIGTTMEFETFGTLTWGDTDCQDGVTTRDNQATLRFVLNQNPLGQTEPCPDIGSPVVPVVSTPTPTPTPSAPTNSPIPTPTVTNPPVAGCVVGDSYPIPDNDPAGVDITFSNPGASIITDVNVCVAIPHDRVGDLRVVIENTGTGASVVLVDRIGIPGSELGCLGDGLFVIFDDEAAQSIDQACNDPLEPVNGTYRPQEPLSEFDGETVGGDRRVNVSDNAAEKTGDLVGASLVMFDN